MLIILEITSRFATGGLSRFSVSVARRRGFSWSRRCVKVGGVKVYKEGFFIDSILLLTPLATYSG